MCRGEELREFANNAPSAYQHGRFRKRRVFTSRLHRWLKPKVLIRLHSFIVLPVRSVESLRAIPYGG